jgi:UDP-N-acetylglucosamine 2-epimerase (non-hydrolysing)
MTIVGTRPEIIRLSRVIARLERHTRHVLVHTGQNYDYELNQVFFEDLALASPAYFLECGGGSLGQTMGRILERIEPVLASERPDAVLILGDTNSSVAGIMAKRMKIPLFHMEAGNRCFDFNVPEEINRRMIDHIADVNIAYSENARRYLLEEGLPEDRVFVSGSPLAEVLAHYRDRIGQSTILKELRLGRGRYFLASVHREENVDYPRRLDVILSALNDLAAEYGEPIVVSTHPRTRKRLEAGELRLNPLIRLCRPFRFTDYVSLQAGARCVLSDSGTISEESAILGFPAVTVRDSIERPEALDAGSIIVTGVERESIRRCVRVAIETFSHQCPDDYRITNTSDRVLRILLGYVRYVNQRVWRKETF